MKKIIPVILFLCVAIVASAKVYYLLPNADKSSFDVNSPVESVYDYLKWESDGTEANTEVSPERKAYEFFKDAFGENYVTFKDVKEGKLTTLLEQEGTVTLWINIDRVGYDFSAYDADFKWDAAGEKLNAFVKAGGNLYLTKQATRFVAGVGRCPWDGWEPNFQFGGYADGNDEWQMCYHFCTDGNIEHSCMQYMKNGQKQDDLDFNTRYPLLSGYNGTYRRTDNGCGWNNWKVYVGTKEGEPDVPKYGSCEQERRTTFESTRNCKVLGGQGHTRELEYAGFIEFYPDGEYKGTIMAMGLAAYQWGPQNVSQYNVENLTKGILQYLDSSAPTFEWITEPMDGFVNTQQTIAVEDKPSALRYETSDSNIATVDADGVVTLLAPGEVTIKAIRYGDGINLPKNAKETFVEKKIKVSTGYTRDVTNGNYGTICLPYAAASFTGAEIYSISGKMEEDAGIYIDQEDIMAAGVPYIFKATADQLVVTYANNEPQEASSANGLIGYIGVEDMTVPKDVTNYIIYSNALYYVDSEAKISTNHAYIDFSQIQGPPAAAPKLKRASMPISGAPTSIMKVNKSNHVIKSIHNGQIVILREGKAYNVLGQSK